MVCGNNSKQNTFENLQQWEDTPLESEIKFLINLLTLGFNVATRNALVRPGWSKSCIAAAVYKAINSKSGIAFAMHPYE